jgi:enediyne biosynthesis protein E4
MQCITRTASLTCAAYRRIHLGVVLLPALLGFACVALSGCSNRRQSVPAQPAAPTTDIRFVDVASQDGLDYRWTITGPRPLDILQGIGNGCAFLDYNNDGNLDILLVGPKLALYKGDGNGHFTDVTHATGLDTIHGHFLGCAVGDYDNDGYEDIYLTAYRGGVLLHNEHGARFVDVTPSSGIKPQPWGTSAAWIDADNDGKLDLYIGDYIDFGPETKPRLCPYDNVMGACAPKAYNPIKGVMYRNMGNGKFENVTSAWNLSCASGDNLGVAPAETGGRYPTIALANDLKAGNLLQFDGRQFHDIAVGAGTAYDDDGKALSGMGIDWGDYDDDGRLDFAVGTYTRETKLIYHNDGNDSFTDESASLGIAQAAIPYVTFGVKWVDVDNDGWLDLVLANGHVVDNIALADPNVSYKQPTVLFYNQRGSHFQDISSALIGDAGRPIVGRGLAVGDFLNNGKMDILVVDGEGAPLLLQNETPQVGHWLEFNLIGTKSNRDGQGAMISVAAGPLRLLGQCSTSGSYMSASDKRVHFGLGGSAVAQKVSVHWPNGVTDTYKDVPGDKIVTLREGDAQPVSER